MVLHKIKDFENCSSQIKLIGFVQNDIMYILVPHVNARIR